MSTWRGRALLPTAVCAAVIAVACGDQAPETARELAANVGCDNFTSTVDRGRHTAGTCTLDEDEVFLAVFGRSGSAIQPTLALVAMSFGCEAGAAEAYLGGVDRVLIAARTAAAAERIAAATGYDLETVAC